MDEHHKPAVDLALPLVWSGKGAEPSAPLTDLIRSASSLAGVVHHLDDACIAALEEAKGLKACLVLVVRPLGWINAGVISRLLRVACEDIQFRIFATRDIRDASLSVVHVCSESNGSVLAFSPAGLVSSHPGVRPGVQASWLQRSDDLQTSVFAEWFDDVWTKSAIVNLRTAAVPHFIPHEADQEACDAWVEYEVMCSASMPERYERSGRLLPDQLPEGGAPVGTTSPATASEELGLPRLSETERKIEAIIANGSQATIAEGTRIPPLEVPLKAEWFDDRPQMRSGSVSRKVQYKVSPIEEEDLKKLEAFRGRTRVLLTRFSFALGRSVRWVPETARPLLQCEMQRVEAEAEAFLKQLIGDDSGKFVAGRLKQLRADAEKMLRQAKRGAVLSDKVFDDIVCCIRDRLDRMIGRPVLPKLDYFEVQGRRTTGPESSDGWGWKYTFLKEVAEYPRRCVSDPYFMRGLKVDQSELLTAMDVAGDTFVRDFLARKAETVRAEQELRILDEIDGDNPEDEQKTKAVLLLIDGKPDKAFDTVRAKPVAAKSQPTEGHMHP